MSIRSSVNNSLRYNWNFGSKSIIFYPLIATIIIILIFYFLNWNPPLDYFTRIIPSISSIMLGFLGMILIASLSYDSIFDVMRKDFVNNSTNGNIVSMYRIFINGIFLNIVLELALLLVSIAIGAMLETIVFSSWLVFVEFSIILYLLVSSTYLFLKNMDRIVSVILYLNK